MTPASAAQQFLSALNAVRRVEPEMTVSQLAVLLLVAAYPGRPMTHIQDKLGMTVSSVSRIVARLSNVKSAGRAGLGLVTNEIDDTHRSRRIITLTAAGQRLVATMADCITLLP